MSRRIMRAFKMHEISAVDRPAQVGARATIMKRDDGVKPWSPDLYWKRTFSQDQRDHAASTGAALPDGSFPIQNGGDLENAIHDVGRASDPAKAKAHIIARAKSLGLTSKLPGGWVSKIGKVEDMTLDEIQKMIAEAVTKATAPLTAEITTLKAKKPPPMNTDDGAEPDADDATKAAWRTYVGKQVAKAVAKAKEELEAEFAKRDEIAKGDEFIKDSDGNEIRKSVVGEQTFKFMKAQQEKIEIAEFGKRAETEIPHLPGDATLKAKVLRAVSKLDKDIRDGIEAMLKGGSAAVKSMTKAAGAHVVEASSSEGQLDVLVKAYADKHNVSQAEAYTKVLDTREGAELYNKMRVEKRSAA